jgi:hypothetical protein
MFTLSERISESFIISVVSGLVFAAEWNEADQMLTVHTCAKAARRKETGSHVRIAIRIHNRSALQSPRSLEALTIGGSDTKIVYDPTQIFTRAAILVWVAKTARGRLPGQIASCHFHAASRTLLVMPHSSVEAAGYDALKRAVAAIMAEADAEAEFDGVAVRVASELPRLEGWLPVDYLSVRPAHYLRGVLRTAAVAVFSTGVLAGTVAHAGTQANHSQLGGLSVFADGVASTTSEGFVSTGLDFFFGEKGMSSQIKLQLAQAAPGSGLRGSDIVIRTDGVNSEIEVLSGSIQVVPCDSPDNVYLAGQGQVIGVDQSCAVRYEGSGQVGVVGASGGGPGGPASS